MMTRTATLILAAAGSLFSLGLNSPVWAQTGQPTATPGTPTTVDPATHAAHAAKDPAAHTTQPGDANRDLTDQVAQLRAQVAQLQAALAQGHNGQPMPAAQGGMSTGGMKNKQMSTGRMGGGAGMAAMPSQPAAAAQPGGMPGMAGGGGGGGMMDNDQAMMAMMQQMMGKMDQMMGGMGGGGGGGMGGGASPMQPGAAAGSGMAGGMKDDMDMMGMGAGAGGGAMPMMDKMMAKGMSQMGGGMNTGSMISALPGFPGASHIYHLGATGFFLDHATHITLTTDQQTRLNQAKEAALTEQATFERKIEQADQDLWTLTASDAPDAAKIEAKAREIEKLRADQRVAFIRAVGNAAGVLTDEQRKQLTGMVAPNPAPQAQPGAMPGGMSDM